MANNDGNGPICPFPISDYPYILLAHGGGGRLMHQLIDDIFSTAFANPDLQCDHDGATIDPGSGELIFTTDSFVVNPLFFPGGDIGSLAVYGTVNDLAMCGACPKYLSAGFIIEEGLPTESLWRIATSMGKAAETACVRIVTGDTKVVERGKGHGVFINTAGIGVRQDGIRIGPGSVKSGDVVILSGDIGRHGIAVIAEREGISFETGIASDCAPLWNAVRRLLEADIDIHCLRDLTRGGLATSAVEIARSASMKIVMEESKIAVAEEVRGACEMLGFDPLYIANEGRFIAIMPGSDGEKAVKLINDSEGTGATVIGRVVDTDKPSVGLISRLGPERMLDMLSGEQLPRIC